MNLKKFENKLTIVCEHCGERYQVLLSKKVKIQLLIIDYAVCPCCHKPRNPDVWQYKDISSGICSNCKIPFSKVEKHGKDVCIMCYFREKREEERKEKRQKCSSIDTL